MVEAVFHLSEAEKMALMVRSDTILTTKIRLSTIQLYPFLVISQR